MSLTGYDAKYLYKNGYPASAPSTRHGRRDLFLTDIECMVDRIHNKNVGAMTIYAGMVGYGKSTAALIEAEIFMHLLAKRQNKKLANKTYPAQELILDEQMSSGVSDFLAKLDLCKKKGHSVILADEFGDNSSATYMSKANNELDRVTDILRQFKIYPIVVLPNIRRLDPRLFEKGLVRRFVWIYKKKEGEYSRAKVYSLKKMFRVLYWMKKDPNPYAAFHKVSPDYTVLFKALPSKRAKELETYCMSMKEGITSELNKDKKDILRTPTELSFYMGCSYQKLYVYMRELKITPSVINGRFKYFSVTDQQKIKAYHESLMKKQEKKEG